MDAKGKEVLGIFLAVVCLLFSFSTVKSYAAEPGFYFRLGSGWSWGQDADFQEDDPTSNPFLYIVFPSAVGGDTLDEIGDSPVVTGGIGYRFCDYFRSDITLSYRWGYELDEWDLAGTSYEADLESKAIMLNGYVDIPLDLGRFRPFIGAGIGVARNKLDDLDWWDSTPASGSIPGGTNTDFAWQVMAGAAIELTDRWSMELGYRYHDAGEFEKDAGFGVTGWYTGSAAGELRAHEAMLEFVCVFGGDKAVAEEPPAIAQPQDSDGDGVYDDRDRCPGTPSGVAVDAWGCPLDTDKDGIFDYLDKCPGTPAGVKVDANGCPLDSDGDGVYDHEDQCPKTPKGAAVDQRGCWVLKGVNFDTNKADIKPGSYKVLDDAVDVLKKNPQLKLEVQGHTDNRGSAQYNQQLSEKRAKSVVDYFVSKDIEKSRMNSAGYGLTKPAASNDTPEGRAQNRRVELKPIY